jgi:hypothetical protein
MSKIERFVEWAATVSVTAMIAIGMTQLWTQVI